MAEDGELFSDSIYEEDPEILLTAVEINLKLAQASGVFTLDERDNLQGQIERLKKVKNSFSDDKQKKAEQIIIEADIAMAGLPEYDVENTLSQRWWKYLKNKPIPSGFEVHFLNLNEVAHFDRNIAIKFFDNMASSPDLVKKYISWQTEKLQKARQFLYSGFIDDDSLFGEVEKKYFEEEEFLNEMSVKYR